MSPNQKGIKTPLRPVTMQILNLKMSPNQKGIKAVSFIINIFTLLNLKMSPNQKGIKTQYILPLH